MNRCYISPCVKFKRHSVDNLVHPICHAPIDEGDVVCFEIPAKSTGPEFKLDIFRYTMQCVYSGESLFPCAFNQESPSDDIRVFFDYVFRTTYRRAVSEKLALALYAHNRSNPPFLYKTLGIFGKCDAPNCLRVSYQNGETFIAATKSIAVGEVLTVRSDTIIVPTPKDKGDAVMQMMSSVAISEAPLFAKALSYRERAAAVRPEGRVIHVNGKLDADLEKRIAKYTFDRETGILDFYADVDNLHKKEGNKQDMLELEELYSKLNEAFEAECGV